MKIAILKEREPNEFRVSLTPEIAAKLIKIGFEIFLEADAGLNAGYSNEQYAQKGVKISKIPLEIIADADIVLKIQPSKINKELDELQFMKENSLIVGLLDPHFNKDQVRKYAQKNIKALAVEFVPRISRAQSMDVLSSQSNLSGYRAVIEAAYESQSAFPMLMTAAGTIAPAKALILGAGVAGLQAIATAKRLGCAVSAFDVRTAAKEQVMSLGAKFIEVEHEENLENSGGYAKETSEEYRKKQEQLIFDHIKNQHIVICTALIPGKPAPKLISKEMIASMKPGSIIVDMATKTGGNCELSKENEIIVTDNGVKIIGYANLASRIAHDASKLYAQNIANLITLMLDENGSLNSNATDEILQESIITSEGLIVNKKLK